MKKIDEGFDTILKSNYELYSVNLFELRDLAKSWYGGVDFNQFDNRQFKEDEQYQNQYNQMKKSGIISNYFFAYREDEHYYLMDGFNRLFTDYGQIKVDCPVYLKVLTDKLPDNHLMWIMFNLNMWKLSSHMGEFRIHDFLDRGFRLFLYSKFGIKFYNHRGYDDYQLGIKRERNEDDINVLDKYFVRERDYAGYFKLDIDELAVLFSRKNIVNDIKEIINSNNYLEKPFNNYEDFLHGFIMFMTEMRIKGDDGEYKFQTYLDKLYEDKKFFKKLQGMCGNDSTRKNIYYFFREKPEKEKSDYQLVIEKPSGELKL